MLKKFVATCYELVDATVNNSKHISWGLGLGGDFSAHAYVAQAKRALNRVALDAVRRLLHTK